MFEDLTFHGVFFWWIFPLATGITVVLTGMLRHYALARDLLDIPNERSSHAEPTPSGGGIVVALVFLAMLTVFWSLNVLPSPFVIALLGAGAWLALIGFIDDHFNILFHWRLAAHFCGAIWALLWLDGLPPLLVFGLSLDLSWLGHLLGVVYLVWMLNLFNFMDGIDGIACIETGTACIGGTVLFSLSQAGGSEWMVLILLFAVSAGFLFWNFPKARIFLGDTGSGFIGIVLGILSIQSARLAPELFWGWVILLGAFVVDATVTLVHRVLQGEKFYEPHCSHAYQYAARKYGAHPPVSLVFGAINMFWLLPVAVLVTVGILDGIVGVVVGYTPLIWLALYFKAGAKVVQKA